MCRRALIPEVFHLIHGRTSIASTSTMNPYIIPFEKLKNKDIEVVGGKNASIGEMISTLPNLGRFGSRRICDDLARLPRFSGAGRPERAHRATRSPRSTSTTSSGSPPSASRSAAGCWRRPSRSACTRRCSQAWRKMGERRRTSPLRYARRPPRRICPRPLSPGSRKPS